MDWAFWRGKRVFITGHTGFKGSWLSYILWKAGATVTGYSLPAPTAPSLYEICRVSKCVNSVEGDIRNLGSLMSAFRECEPEIVIHLAAQPLVRESYHNPAYTYETNVMGTVNILECARLCGGVRSLLNVTTDKVYQNNEWHWGYRETDPLDGYDPYSNSKSCSELVTHSYCKAFFSSGATAVSTARAGNVIGGGDFALDRIVPDCVRSVKNGEAIIVRNPDSVRPYQHVLEPLFAYLLIAGAQYMDDSKSGRYNIGPDDADCVKTRNLVDLFCKAWGGDAEWAFRPDNGPHESTFLRLDSSLIKSTLGWSPRWNIEKAILATVEWAKAHMGNCDIRGIMDSQINDYLSGGE